jgi:hypothetical protein
LDALPREPLQNGSDGKNLADADRLDPDAFAARLPNRQRQASESLRETLRITSPAAHPPEITGRQRQKYEREK